LKQVDLVGIEKTDKIVFVIIMCSNEVEDEYHFVSKCPLYDDIRRQFLNRTIIYTRPSMEKFISLLKSNNKNILVNFSKFIFVAMIRRNENINR